MPRRLHHTLFLVVLCAFAGLLAAQRASTAPAPPLRITGPETTVFDWTTDRCATDNIPDLPARVIRDSRGQVQLFMSHFETRRLTGPDLDHLTPDCAVTQGSDANPDPAAFDDRRWIAAPYTLDGTTIYALDHVEYQGNQHLGMCPSLTYFSCWYNALTLATSLDGGATFQSAPAPTNLVATVPFTYVPDGGPVGIFEPSNIVRSPKDGAYYTLARVIGPANTPRGACLLRTTNLADAQSWRAWGGRSFDVTFVDPYLAPVPGSHVCAPVATSDISEMTQSLTYNSVLQRFLLVGTSGDWDPQAKRTVWGIYYSTSTDLLHWTHRQLLVEAELTWTYQCGDADPLLYPSLIDPGSPSRSFDTTGTSAYLYYTRFHYAGCQQTMDRDLVRVPVTISR